jgi:hypothetical protein
LSEIARVLSLFNERKIAIFGVQAQVTRWCTSGQQPRSQSVCRITAIVLVEEKQKTITLIRDVHLHERHGQVNFLIQHVRVERANGSIVKRVIVALEHDRLQALRIRPQANERVNSGYIREAKIERDQLREPLEHGPVQVGDGIVAEIEQKQLRLDALEIGRVHVAYLIVHKA